MQSELASLVDITPDPPVPGLVAGADVCCHSGSGRLFGAVVILSFPQLELRERVVSSHRHAFPYIPGLLAAREAPIIAQAFSRAELKADLLFVDGQGIAHPRRFGLACHLGLLLGIPTIGCAKSRLVGEHRAVGWKRGDWVWLIDRGERVGVVLRTRDGVRPVYVSPGHGIGFAAARRVTLQACRELRLPEPLRQAHMAAAEACRRCAA